ncbi:hypothetical protein H9185_001187 [Listeria monocytogenes]|nr:hypothetical protein [Listeria monocytogenes]
MREILFRGVSTDSIEWIEGWYEMYPYGRWPLKETIIPAEEAKGGHFHHVEVIPETVGQFTGLTDKNGKKIFEGDICRVCLDPEICIAHIQYDERTASFNMRYNDYQCNTFLDMRLAENRVGDRVWIEVIGNIHDNPELLEGQRIEI